MQWKLQSSPCTGTQVIIIQDQGDNTPTVITVPYDATGYDYEGTVAFPVPIALGIGTGITVDDIISCTGSVSNTTLTISAVAYGTIYVGMPVNGVGILEGTYITALGTGTGGVGTYTINLNQTVASTTIVASKLLLQLTSEQTQDIPEGQYNFDMWSISPAMIRAPLIKGFFEINEALTRIT